MFMDLKMRIKILNKSIDLVLFMKKAVLLIIVLYLFLPLCAQSKYPAVEHLVFNGYYNWGFLWVKAGNVEFSLSKSEKYPKALRLKAVGASQPSWDWVFRLRDTLVSHFDEENYMPYEFSRKAHEGNYHKTFEYRWNYRDSMIYGDIHRIGKYKRKDTVRLQAETYDMLSVAWRARELDFDKYKPNEMIPIKILIDSKIYGLYVRYLGIDNVKINKVQYPCYVFSPLLVEGEVFKGGENMKIWVSKDKNRLPMMVEAKILVGSVKAILDPASSKY